MSQSYETFMLRCVCRCCVSFGTSQVAQYADTSGSAASEAGYDVPTWELESSAVQSRSAHIDPTTRSHASDDVHSDDYGSSGEAPGSLDYDQAVTKYHHFTETDVCHRVSRIECEESVLYCGVDVVDVAFGHEILSSGVQSNDDGTCIASGYADMKYTKLSGLPMPPGSPRSIQYDSSSSVDYSWAIKNPANVTDVAFLDDTLQGSLFDSYRDDVLDDIGSENGVQVEDGNTESKVSSVGEAIRSLVRLV